MRQPNRLPYLAFAVAATPFLIISGYTALGFGAWNTVGIELLFIPLVLAAIAIPILLLIAVFNRPRREALILAQACAGAILGGVVGNIAGAQLRMRGFELAARRAEPLVAAVSAYQHRHGRPPATIAALIPEYLPSLPPGLPPMELRTGERAQREFGGNDWALVAKVSRGMSNWDLFLYLPNQNYPPTGYGGTLERLGDWVYVHE